MRRKQILFIGALVALMGVGLAAPAAGGVPPTAGCPAQFVADFHSLFPDFTFGELISGAVQTDHPFGQALKPQATAPHDQCPIDLTP